MYKANELILLQVLAVGLLLLSITSTPRLFPACVRPPDTGIATRLSLPANLAASLLNLRSEALPTPPIPGRYELTSPEAQLFSLGIGFLCNIVG